MNKPRRARLAKLAMELDAIKSAIEECASEERDYFDNIPENMQQGERAQASEAAADALDQVVSSIDEALTYLEESQQ